MSYFLIYFVFGKILNFYYVLFHFDKVFFQL